MKDRSSSHQVLKEGISIFGDNGYRYDKEQYQRLNSITIAIEFLLRGNAYSHGSFHWFLEIL